MGFKVTVNIKEAVEAAKEALGLVFASEGAHSIRLEEVILDDYYNWVITLSYLRNVHIPEDNNPLSILGGVISGKRAYKVVTLDKETGDVKSIKIRDDA